MNRFIFFFIALSFSFGSVTNAQSDMPEVFIGPVKVCQFKSDNLELQDIDIKIYSKDIFGTGGMDIMISYSFPEIASSELASFINKLSPVDSDEGDEVYEGQITNISYLIEVKLVLSDNPKLIVINDIVSSDYEGEYTGQCSVPELPF